MSSANTFTTKHNRSQTETEGRLLEIFLRLFKAFGPQRWWPGDDPFEIILGAILTQSANWGNVEKALGNLKEVGALNPPTLRNMPLEELARLIYSSGYYNAKAAKIKAFVNRLGEAYGDDLERLFALEPQQLRQELLSIYGIGEETADAIILYVALKPMFVVDNYTRRTFNRLGLAPSRGDYRSFQALFHRHLPQDTELFNEYHALIVRHGKEICRKEPLCHVCCLNSLCPTFAKKGR